MIDNQVYETDDKARIAFLYDKLQAVATSYSPDKLRRISEKEYGLPADEAIEYTLDNVQTLAKNALKGFRRPKPVVRAAASIPPKEPTS